MDRDEHSARQPLHGPRRPQLPALVGVLALVVVIVLVFGLITWVRYTT
jgi:hypothetical protein